VASRPGGVLLTPEPGSGHHRREIDNAWENGCREINEPDPAAIERAERRRHDDGDPVGLARLCMITRIGAGRV
jgi:hypothetical protein